MDKVDVTTPEHFIAAGFDVTFVGPDAEPSFLAVTGAGVDESSGVIGSACKAEGGDELVVKEDVFRRWLELSAMRRGVEFSRWWVNKELDEEGAIDTVKLADDESATDLFDRIRIEVIFRRTPADRKFPDGGLPLADLVAWIQEKKVLHDCEDVEALTVSFCLSFKLLHRLQKDLMTRGAWRSH